MTELGYVLSDILKKERKCSFENSLVEKSKSSTNLNKWFSRRIVLCNQLNIHLHGFVSSLSLLISTGIGADLSMSNLLTSVFKLAKFVFSAKLAVSTFFRSVLVA